MAPSNTNKMANQGPPRKQKKAKKGEMPRKQMDPLAYWDFIPQVNGIGKNKKILRVLTQKVHKSGYKANMQGGKTKKAKSENAKPKTVKSNTQKVLGTLQSK